MGCFRRYVLVAFTLFGIEARASAMPVPPAHLPQYVLTVQLDTPNHQAVVRERVTWTNTTKQPQSRLAFNFYPAYRVPDGDHLLFAKMVELMRLHPSGGIDRAGRHGVVKSASLVSQNSSPQALAFSFEEHNPCALWVTLPTPVGPGESVTVDLDVCIRLPNKHGRWGHWEGVTFLSNALPLLAFIDDRGWKPVPYVPWAQPWYNEAGVFRASVTLPANELLACPAVVKSETQLEGGWKRIDTEPFVGRDFALICSARYKEFRGEARLPDGRCVALKCLAFPEHEHYATEMLKMVGEAIPVFSRWFGHFPYPQFTIAESIFGWNGNECAGLVMIDERVFGMPHLARGYVEYLVSHETCHQWWYNLVGTNGYCEPFMDEGAATYFTHRLLDQKRGKNSPFMEWPAGLKWLPNIHRENYRYGSMYNSIRNGEMRPAAQELPKYGHVVGLFTGAYDRGSKVFRLIEEQLGEAGFLDFTRMIVAKYSWKVLHAAEYRRELEEFTGRDWGQFFDRWVYGKGTTDWAVDRVDVENDPGPLARIGQGTRRANGKTVVTLSQRREDTEPTTLGLRWAGQDGYSVRVPILPSEKPYRVTFPNGGAAEAAATVETTAENTVRVTLENLHNVEQIAVDPDGVLLDANPANNLWKGEPRFRLTPLFSSLDEADLTNDYDRWNFIAGPWAWGQTYQDPWYTRSTMVGLRAGAYRNQKFAGGVYAAYRTDIRDLVVGADAAIKFDHGEVGASVERRVGGPWGDSDAKYGESAPLRAMIYARNIRRQSSSLYLHPIMYDEAFLSYQDNFLPYSRSGAGERPEHSWLGGYHFRLNLYTPYWDPECGVWVDLMAGGGQVKFNRGDTEAMGQLRGELAGVRQLPEEWGALGKARVAGRALWMGAVPERGQFFALGGGTLFRGFDLAERQGSMLWVANLELRYPLAKGVTWDVLDHVVGARSLWLATFYDVGRVYANGRGVGETAHAIGAGLRMDIAVFSFIERATLRFDAAKTINAATPVQFWFGVQHAF